MSILVEEGRGIFRVLVMRSSGRLDRLFRGILRGGKCRIGDTSSKTRTLRMLSGRCVSLVVSSVVVPIVSNCRLISRLHSTKCRVPILVVATGNSFSSVHRKFLSKDSSCVMGPMGIGRVILEIKTLLHHTRVLGRRGVIVNSARFSCSTVAIAASGRDLILPGGRFLLLCGLTTSPNEAFAGRRLVSRM